MEQQELIPHLFRTEFSKITAVLCRRFGAEFMTEAEDIASETFFAAFRTWPYKGVPENPVAWLYAVAKNKAINHLRHKRFFSEIAGELAPYDNTTTEIDWSDKNITDSQLQTLFAICQPSIPTEAQIGLALRILCGFGIEEIANAFLTSKETVNKRLFRAKEKLRQEKVKIEFPQEDQIESRLDAVLTTLYLFFNEGYYSESREPVLREDLCLEAMRLSHLLTENEQTNKMKTNALLALMCFHASRFPARKNDRGEIVLYHNQEEKLWDRRLIAKGAYYLNRASYGDAASKYHIEAAIGYWHTVKKDSKEKWTSILQLYNQLLVVAYSPIAALNRTFALSRVYGNEKAIDEAEKLNLSGNHYYYTLLGELYKTIHPEKAAKHFQKALAIAKTQADKQIIAEKIARLRGSCQSVN